VTRVHTATLLAVILSGRGEEPFGYKVLTVSSAAVPNGIAPIYLAMRDEFGLVPHVYFDWTEAAR
jgi:hypothetical protein